MNLKIKKDNRRLLNDAILKITTPKITIIQ